MSLRETTISAVKWSTVRAWGSKAISFLTLLVLARLLGPDEFGLVALASVFIALLTPFVDQGFGDAIVQREDLELGHLDTAFWTSVGFGVMFCAGSWATAPLVADLFREPELAAVIRWLSFSFILTALSGSQQAILRRTLRFRPLAIRSTVSALVAGSAGVASALLGLGVWSLVVQSLVGSITGTLLLWTVSDYRPGTAVSMAHFRELFSFGSGIIGVNFLNFFNRRSDDLIVGLFLGSVALGYYSVAYKVLRLTTELMTSVVSAVAFPVFSRLQDDLARIQRGFTTVTRITSVIAFPMFVGLAIVAPELIGSLFGDRWLPSIPVMRVLSLIGVVHSVFYFHSAVLLALGKSGVRFALTLLNAVANVIGFLIAVRWGIVAVAAAYVIRAYLLTPVDIRVTTRLLKLSYGEYFGTYRPAVIATASMGIVVAITRVWIQGRVPEPVVLAIAIIVGIPIYVGTMFVVDRQVVSELTALVRSRRKPRGVVDAAARVS